jgi:ATP-dependent RNA helicase DeaD
LKTFQDLGVSPALRQGLEELGINTPTRVQEEAIPFLLEKGTDLIVQAQTGTGKTAAFGLPLLTKIDPKLPKIQAVVLAPTRELAKQIAKQLFRFTKHTEKIFTEALCGGEDMDRQINALQRPTHIVVATPGRLVDLIKRKALTLATVKYVVLDEADEMLSMGFKKELELILAMSRDRRSTWLFSATIPDGIKGLIKDYMSAQAQTLKIDRAHVVNRDISHCFLVSARDEKLDLIAEFLTKQQDKRGLIFCRTRAGAIELAKQLTKRNFPIDVIHGDLMQKERDKAMRGFKKNRAQFLIATDVAARGIDIDSLSFVIHHQLPDQLEAYTHRSGRTGRAGKKGISLVLLDPRERAKLHSLENELAINFMEWKFT